MSKEKTRTTKNFFLRLDNVKAAAARKEIPGSNLGNYGFIKIAALAALALLIVAVLMFVHYFRTNATIPEVPSQSLGLINESGLSG